MWEDAINKTKVELDELIESGAMLDSLESLMELHAAISILDSSDVDYLEDKADINKLSHVFQNKGNQRFLLA